MDDQGEGTWDSNGRPEAQRSAPDRPPEWEQEGKMRQRQGRETLQRGVSAGEGVTDTPLSEVDGSVGAAVQFMGKSTALGARLPGPHPDQPLPSRAALSELPTSLHLAVLLGNEGAIAPTPVAATWMKLCNTCKT